MVLGSHKKLKVNIRIDSYNGRIAASMDFTPSCIVGSAVAGAISMAFDCTLMAPHGGIFAFPVVGNAVMYLVALVVGTVISAVLLGLLKKKAA